MSANNTIHCSSAPPAPTRRNWLTRLFRLDALYRERRMLEDLPPERLRDMGLTDRDVRHERARPIWDAPARWRD